MIYDSLIGRRLDEYHLENLLGQGGMARVYRALDVRLNRWVAIKVIAKPFRADADYTGRFEQEARAIAQLEHPHIVRLYRYDEADGLLYMVLQYIEGTGLDRVLATYRQDGEFIEPEEASRIVREVCSALDYAHSKGVIHRDVKPANIILNKQGNAILVDFGLALLADVQAGQEAFGTPHYMAPEQVRSPTQVVPQSDLYALGVILYEMFTGRLPFEASDPADVALLQVQEPPPPPREFRPELSLAVETVILRALAKEPQARYPSGLALANALDRALRVASPQGTTAPPPTLSRLSIPERVALHMTERALPPLPPGVTELPPDLVETQPAPVIRKPPAIPVKTEDGAAARPMPQVREQAGPTPSLLDKRWPAYAAIALVLLLIVLAGAFLLWWFLPGEEVGQTPLPTPPVVDTPPPPAAPQLVADSRQDFSNSQAGNWKYLTSSPDENDFEEMDFEERKYGTCWYGDEDEDYVRICQTSAHPGLEADVAWRWTSPVSGPIRVVISARKIDAGGDGVTLIAYHNGQAVEGLRLGPDDTGGVSDRNFFEAEVNAGDQLLFVLKKNDRVEYDHTALQVQIYLQ